MIKSLKRAMGAFLLVGLMAGAVAEYVGAFDPPDTSLSSSESSALSPYWSYKVQRWEDLIVQEADRRSLDPDLLASLMWQESRGDPDALGPKGAVGLMQVMPKEAGFTWRPSQATLLNPSVNLFWGTRTLATVIEQGDGDVFHALAAYNGGWDQVGYRRPRRFAMTILRDYAHAVALRHGMQGRWIAFFAVQNAYIHGPIWVADSSREDVYFYGQVNAVPEGKPLVPNMPPISVVAGCESKETGATYSVGIWLYSVDQDTWNVYDTLSAESPVPPTPTSLPTLASTSTPTVAPTSTPAATLTPSARSTTTHSPTPTLTPTMTPTPGVPLPTGSGARVLDGGAELRPGPTLWWDPTETLPAGTAVDLLGYDPRSPDWVYVRTLDDVFGGWTQVEDLQILGSLKDLPSVTPMPTLTPTTTATTTPTPTPTVACTGESLSAEAWPLEKYYTSDNGWGVVIYARGYGGNCVYTYAWDEESNVVSGPVVLDGITFRLSLLDRASNIVGTMVVMSGNETFRVGVFIKPPGSDE